MYNTIMNISRMKSIDMSHLRNDQEIIQTIRNQSKIPGTGLIYDISHCNSRQEENNLYDTIKKENSKCIMCCCYDCKIVYVLW